MRAVPRGCWAGLIGLDWTELNWIAGSICRWSIRTSADTSGGRGRAARLRKKSTSQVQRSNG